MTNNPQRELRNAMGNFATGITVITALDGQGNPRGMTANSFSSVSLEPAMVSWCVGRDSRLFELFQQTDHFAVNILHSGQQAISQLFAGSEQNKFDHVNWHPGLHGLPILDDCPCHFQCRIEHRHPGGDHIILVGRVLEFSNEPLEPLIFHGGQYRTLK
ncbi:flavin reductase family protein [Porticoccus litoralis]|uniref:Flavin reductase family protein n=1 Tax=Porticoccus litoralis TaxID=434086 RepID=A0AAW8B3B0_9GAMM|nr:flavin reductase family protein [Porticoccus litoralis]MDP1520224.1 flavin reductase family protein [Porticoccus litoralis]TNE87815.1 MAG: flavin reductase [Gammaproteobacteria bacterium]